MVDRKGNWFSRFIKGISLSLLGFLLLTLAGAGVVIGVVSSNITDRQTIESWVVRPGVHGAMDELLPQIVASQSQGGELDKDLQDENSDINKLYDEFFTEDFYLRASGVLVNSTYDFLEGKTETIDFEVPVSENEDEFREFIVQAFKTKASELPVCSDNQVSLDEFNPFSSECRPKAVKLSQIESQIENGLGDAEIQKLYDSATITDENLGLQIENPDKYQNIYSWVNRLPSIIALSLFISVMLIFAIERRFEKSSKIVGVQLLVASAPIALTAYLVTSYREKILNYISSTLNEAANLDVDFANLVNSSIGVILDDVFGDILKWALVVIAIALALLTARLIINNRSDKPKPSAHNSAHLPGYIHRR